MQQLTTLDAWFINESETSFQHICDILVFDADGPGLTLAELRAHVEPRLHLVPPMRRRLVEVPFGMDEPYWIEDPEFDLDNHLFETTLPAPGSERALTDFVAALAGKPLDRSRPLWELHLVHGLEGGRTALVKKFHHAAVDGGSGLEVTAILLDSTPEPRVVPAPEQPWQPDRVPEPGEMLMRGFGGLATRPLRMLEVQRKLRGQDGELLKSFRLAPDTPLNRKITAARGVAIGSVPLAEVKAIKTAFGVTINDVIVSLSAGALREWLLERDALPEQPLRVCIPVSVRGDDQQGTFGNRVSILIADLPTHVADPVERLRATHEAIKVAKDEHEASGADLLADIGEFAMPALQARVSRATAGMELPDEPLRFNVAVSNLPGPRVPQYLAGHRLEAHYPIGMIADNQALNITVASYLDSVGFGLVGSPEVVPDLPDCIGRLTAAKDELLAAAAVSA
jgi:diacylglycerol O-acyltransferase